MTTINSNNIKGDNTMTTTITTITTATATITNPNNNKGDNSMKNYIIINALKEAEGSELRPCIKQEVFAMLVTAEGKEYFGANWMTNGDVSVCPRVTNNCASGTGYELCSEVCNQLFHAERFAISACENAGDNTVGSTVYVAGHTYCCDGCIAAMKEAGVVRAFVVDSGKEYIF